MCFQLIFGLRVGVLGRRTEETGGTGGSEEERGRGSSIGSPTARRAEEEGAGAPKATGTSEAAGAPKAEGAFKAAGIAEAAGGSEATRDSEAAGAAETEAAAAGSPTQTPATAAAATVSSNEGGLK